MPTQLERDAERTVQRRKELNTWLWETLKEARDPKLHATDLTMDSRHPYIQFVNQKAEELLELFP